MKRLKDKEQEFVEGSRDRVMFEDINIKSNTDIDIPINSDINSNIKINIKSNMKKERKPKQEPFFTNVSSEYALAINELSANTGYNKRELVEMAFELLFKEFKVEFVKE